MSIRKALKGDFSELFDLVMGNMKHHIKINKLKWEPIDKIKKLELKSLKEDFNDKKIKIFIYEIEGKIVGYINFSIIKCSSYTKVKYRGEIHDLFVSKKYRKKGIGKKLVNYALSFFNSKNIKNIFISVSSNNISSITFYENLGFKETVKKMNLSLK